MRLVLRVEASSISGIGLISGIPPPPWISGIIHLEENREIIYGAQQLAGKILIRKELSLSG